MDRPVLRERREYAPNLPVEQFMVPLLRGAVEEVIARLPADRPSFKVLDMGCGGQPFRQFFEAKAHQYVGVDAQDPYGIVDHIMYLDQQTPPALAARGPFDFILCTEVLEHVADWPAAFANLKALLAPDGLLLITVPHVYVLHEQPYDFWRPTVHALRHYAAKHDLDVIELRMLGNTWDVLGTILGAACDGVEWKRTGVVAKLASKVLRRVVMFACWLTMSKRLRREISLDDSRLPVYLSNLALLQNSNGAASRPPGPA